MSPRKRILMVAFDYPPSLTSSGVQRTLKFSQYLPEYGWHPTILTAHPRAYTRADPGQLGEIPKEVKVIRAFALDSARHLSIAGRYLDFTALPDRWVSWILPAVMNGLSTIRADRPDVIYSTFPIASAHVIAYVLHRMTDIPWVADFRDPMIQRNHPNNPRIRRLYEAIEKKVFQYSAMTLVTTPGARNRYLDKYRALRSADIHVVPNGYDEAIFRDVEDTLTDSETTTDSEIRVIHNGTLYPDIRDPRHFFHALSILRDSPPLTTINLRVIFRAPGHDAYIRQLCSEFGIEDLIEIAPLVSHTESIREILSADGLLLLQSESNDAQIPAKAYEFLRTGNPILTLAGLNGDTAALMRKVKNSFVADISDVDMIANTLNDFLLFVQASPRQLADKAVVRAYARRSITATLADILYNASKH